MFFQVVLDNFVCDWFKPIIYHAIAVRHLHITLSVGGAQNDNGNALERRGLLRLLQNTEAVEPQQTQVEQHQRWESMAYARKEILHRFRGVRDLHKQRGPDNTLAAALCELLSSTSSTGQAGVVIGQNSVRCVEFRAGQL
jgi:hypothetical protein